MSNSAPFISAHGSGPDWQSVAQDCATQLKSAEPEHRLGFLYVTDHFSADLSDISNFLKNRIGVDHWVGTVGLGVCTTSKEYFDEPAMVVMIIPARDSAFRIFDNVSDSITAITDKHASWLSNILSPLTVVHGDPRNQNINDLIEKISSETEGFLVGGLTASQQNFFQLADGVSEGGLSGAMLALDEIPAQVGVTQGCSPIGSPHRITAADQNLLIELDGKPALEVFKEDVGEVLARDLQRAAGYIFVALPVSASDTGDYLVRNLLGVDSETGVVAIGDHVTAGDQIMFCRRDHDSAITDMKRMLSDIKSRTEIGAIRGGLYFSCCARGPNQFGSDSEELKIISSELGDFPLVGFFANGEISNNRLYGYTGVLTVFL